MGDNPNFTVEYLNDAIQFLRSIDVKAAGKILQSIDVATRTNDPKKFKKLENSNIWEFRTEFNKQQYRLFAFWDVRRNAIVVATHGIIKKKQKTPAKEIQKAERIRTEYLNNSENG